MTVKIGTAIVSTMGDGTVWTRRVLSFPIVCVEIHLFISRQYLHLMITTNAHAQCIPIGGTLSRHINWIRNKCRSVWINICRVTSKIDVHLLVFASRSNQQHIVAVISWSPTVLQPSHELNANQFRLFGQFSPLIKPTLKETQSICLFRASILRFDRNQN